jgi:hypothetical protein
MNVNPTYEGAIAFSKAKAIAVLKLNPEKKAIALTKQ